MSTKPHGAPPAPGPAPVSEVVIAATALVGVGEAVVMACTAPVGAGVVRTHLGGTRPPTCHHHVAGLPGSSAG